MTPQQLENMRKATKSYKEQMATAAMIAGQWHIVAYYYGEQTGAGTMRLSGLIEFSKYWEGEQGLCLLVDGEPRSQESEDLLVQAGFSFYRADRTGAVKQASYRTRPDGSRGGRGWKKTALTVQDVEADPYGLWL